ncbi:Uncharacterised protein [Mycobacteroides abscessus subsp. abscessus]|nr:Uncharacterised protein [Mycobacteroides abscessus subsp. abscessus]
MDEAKRSARWAWFHDVGASRTATLAPMPSHGPRSECAEAGNSSTITSFR